MKIRRSPQEKKALSYAKDRRNVYGERGSHSRHAIRDSKDQIERSRRHSENQILHAAIEAQDEEKLIAVENSLKSNPAIKKRFHKMPDAPLGEVIENKLAYRVRQGMGVKKNTKQRRAA